LLSISERRMEALSCEETPLPDAERRRADRSRGDEGAAEAAGAADLDDFAATGTAGTVFRRTCEIGSLR
jgi:hypothetical protein